MAASSPPANSTNLTDATLAEAGIEERGAIFTRREVVEFILELAGYRGDQPLHRMRLLEPSFGDGDFLLPLIGRLLAAWRASPDRQADPVAALSGCIRAVELHRATFASTRLTVISHLTGHGLTPADAQALADAWLIQGDFLLIDLPSRFDFVVGNPPYVRQELIPDAVMAAYRARYATVYDRADLYIPFIERSLTQLEEGGQLGFICADRWMKNRYGGPLRQLVAKRFHLKTYVDMFATQAFHMDVIAYPAITIIARVKVMGKSGAKATRIAHRPETNAHALSQLAGELTAPKLAKGSTAVREIDGVAAGAEPWILESSDQLSLVRRLEAEFPALEEAGCKVGIGVATGADQAFIGWLVMVEDEHKSRRPGTRDASRHYPVSPDFKKASYLQRYDLLCQKLVRENLYTAACALTSKRAAVDGGAYGEMSNLTSLTTFVSAFAGHIAAETARSSSR